jgi:hypothetical protein
MSLIERSDYEATFVFASGIVIGYVLAWLTWLLV